MKTNERIISGNSSVADWHLRVTILPQCNLKCQYCNPQGVFQRSPRLNDLEILEIVAASIECGICRVHWTGGEPCIRNIVSLAQKSKDIGMIQQIMTTNGTLRLLEIPAMKQAGINRVNISLDSLDPAKNSLITGRKYFDTTMQWIHKACQTFDMETKMNVVAMADNLDEIPSFIKFAQSFNGKLVLKFIELCPNNPAFYHDNLQDHFVTRDDIIAALTHVGVLHPTSCIGDNPNAEYYAVGTTGVKVILVTMPSQGFKCGLSKCRKLRVSPYGLAGSCLQQKGIQLMHEPYEKKVAIIRKLMSVRESYSDGAPVERKHLRLDYGFWRFGELNKQANPDECSKS